MRAAMTGHLVLSTLHTNDAQSTPLRLVDMGVARYMVALSLQLVIAQRLVRVLCSHCAEEHVPDAREAEWLALELGSDLAAHRFRASRGCGECNHTGYSGRTGVYEFLEMRGPLIDALAHGEPSIFVRAAREQMGGATLRRDAVRLAALGRTTIDEAMRVSSQVDE
jgi:MSHA biogenesis protein MshE